MRGHFFRDELRDRDERRGGTFAPARRAWLSPMAMACLRLVTFLPDRPDLSVPRFFSCMARSTFLPALGPYLRPPARERDPRDVRLDPDERDVDPRRDDFLSAMDCPFLSPPAA